jgi:hypothetical protein
MMLARGLKEIRKLLAIKQVCDEDQKLSAAHALPEIPRAAHLSKHFRELSKIG